jgi:hypothetical protein
MEGTLAGRRADVLEMRQLIRRVLGETDRRIVRDLQVSRKTVRKYRAWRSSTRSLAGPLPDAATLQAQLKTTLPVSTPPATLSKVTPFRDQVAALRERCVESLRSLKGGDEVSVPRRCAGRSSGATAGQAARRSYR